MLLKFAGSSHKKYMGYLLEQVCDLELDSHKELQEASLTSIVVNPEGKVGGFLEADIFQEGLNRCIEPIIPRKDAEVWFILHTELLGTQCEGYL
ncbi:hypothetical protein HGRIS_011094 [Hohenbuehelia grisea]|uniref:DUF6589 domain-containing protein n=1 Tax=Hohenbuehelia grisea TaxID=104357 RepID=A0ABR3IZ27_9AGAR